MIDDRGHATGSSGTRAGVPVLLVRKSGIPEVDMGIDHARKRQRALGIEHFCAAGYVRPDRCNLYDLPVLYRDIDVLKAAIQQHLCILDDQIWHGIYLSCPCQRIYRLTD
ncbi:MAG: hypothetical protein C5S48_00035 [Candidatus Methanogaster sp.]|nr:MAG: hypothetical protein C5S48_00035 [ANME-2 cluster archaeon]